jgi:hypothetical protein
MFEDVFNVLCDMIGRQNLKTKKVYKKQSNLSMLVVLKLKKFFQIILMNLKVLSKLGLKCVHPGLRHPPC